MSEYKLDVGLLTITDTSVISGPMRREEELLDSATKGLKTLIGEIIELPTELKKGKHEGVSTMVKLPQPVIRLPREKAPPKPKPLTAWQKFALKKGIALNRKKTNRVFDEERQEWKDKWGKRAREDKEKYDWLREVGHNYVPQEDGGDPFLDEKRKKKARLEVQKKKEDHNKRRAEKLSKDQDEIKKLEYVSKHLATASNGKFERNREFKKNKKMK